MCKNVPETVQWIKKVRILWKNGLNFKLKHRNAQKSILSGRFGALTRRSGDLMKNLETPGKTGRVGRYGFCILLAKSKCECLLNYPHQNGELSSSHKQPLITLLDFLKNCRPISFVNVDGKIACKVIRIGHTITYFHQPKWFHIKRTEHQY